MPLAANDERFKMDVNGTGQSGWTNSDIFNERPRWYI